MIQRRFSLAILLAASVAFGLPLLANAQGRYPDYNPNDRYDNRYDNRYVKDSIQRLDRLAKDFQKDLDHALDHSRADGSRREDSINQQGKRFRSAVSDLKSRFGNGRDLSRSRNEAVRVMQEADQLDRMTRTRWFDSRLATEWLEIRRELNNIERAYGISYNGNGRNDDWGRGRRNNSPWWQNIPLPRW